MTLFGAFKSTALISWKSSGKLQQTIAKCIERTGKGLHSGKAATVRISPEFAGEGRYFSFRSELIPASIDFSVESPLCTTLSKEGHSIRTVEHLLSSLEATGVDNCRIEICSFDSDDLSAEVPIFDGSAREWVEAIEQVGLQVARDRVGNCREKMAPFLNEPVYVQKNESFVAAFPSPEVHISYGINFHQVPAIGCQWFFSASMVNSFYAKQIAPSRTFCIYAEVEQMRNAGLIKGGSVENAIICSTSRGWLNPPLRFQDEPCRHKVLDLIGDLSLLARCGSQGLPVAHIVAYKELIDKLDRL
ncbi:probable UDP-3-O-acyl-N-acetylglucosamine deacetylase 1, mitochondrial isoform X2 [Diospyros lotus]|uniref:probable UDP-3-O-acyl-N-acetylglucosamine deacetylase 1, mitochondrial isoform X2 n=1 Tax=Diospyros lotus TaxID=55363 RepID=UPI00224E33A7|nr:probable UDP-3-O-acyl-N-acetylglucosamine deacetylase 1, mitochondrial isoform X2 [Diospyros lotus]XP_052206263.1 probable UDP-3-O-acyl-N-acetylglucosamine deacetylase 1, mitochondrial isoform X2 [Diospyros lotus]